MTTIKSKVGLEDCIHDPDKINSLAPEQAANLISSWEISGDPAPAGNILAALAAKASEAVSAESAE